MSDPIHDDSLVFDVLGALEVRRHGRTLDAGPRQRRLFLLRLIIAEQRPVPVERLFEDLWTGSPPPAAISSVQSHVSRLRAVLQPDPADRQVLVRERAGYALLVPPTALTSHRFPAAVERTRHLMSRGRFDAARAEIDRALRSWRGAAFAEAAGLPFVRAESARLDKAHVDGQELSIELLLRAGDTMRAVADAWVLVSEHPLRESAWCLLIRALYLSGRPAEALQQYNRVRSALVTQLNVEPGPALRELQVAVLQHDVQTIGSPAQADRRRSAC